MLAFACPDSLDIPWNLADHEVFFLYIFRLSAYFDSGHFSSDSWIWLKVFFGFDLQIVDQFHIEVGLSLLCVEVIVEFRTWKKECYSLK